MQYICEDVVGIIINKKPDLMALMLVSKRYYKIVNKLLKIQVPDKLSKQITLKRKQYIASYYINKKMQDYQNVVLNCPPGFGKTFTAIHYVFFRYEFSAFVVVPPHVLKVWIEEIEKISYYHSNPEETKVIIYDTCRQKHKKYCDNNIDKICEQYKMVIMKVNTYKKYYYEVMKMNPGLIIYDESHKENINIPYNTIQTLGLTAEYVLPRNNTEIISFGYNDYYLSIPMAIHSIINLDKDNEGSLSTIIHSNNKYYEYQSKYRKAISKKINKYNKPVICVGDGVIGADIKTWISEECPDYKIFNLKTSAKTIDKFLTCNEPSILFIGTTCNEGLNIPAEALILINPDIMSAIRIKQLTSRLLRPNSEYKQVYINHILMGKSAALKIAYTRCFSDCRWNFKIEEYPTANILKHCHILLKFLDKSPSDISNVDGCVIFNNFKFSNWLETILSWWNYNKEEDTCLTEDIIKLMYI